MVTLLAEIEGKNWSWVEEEKNDEGNHFDLEPLSTFDLNCTACLAFVAEEDNQCVDCCDESPDGVE